MKKSYVTPIEFADHLTIHVTTPHYDVVLAAFYGHNDANPSNTMSTDRTGPLSALAKSSKGFNVRFLSNRDPQNLC